MYHSVADCRDDPYLVTVSPDRFAGQMRWLRRPRLARCEHARTAGRAAPRAGPAGWSA